MTPSHMPWLPVGRWVLAVHPVGALALSGLGGAGEESPLLSSLLSLALVLLLTKFHFEMWLFAVGIYTLRNKTKVPAKGSLRSALGGPECFPQGRSLRAPTVMEGWGRFGGVAQILGSLPVLVGVAAASQ